MKIKCEHLLNEEIVAQLETIGKTELGTDESRTMIDGTTKLIDRLIELEKLKIEEEDKRTRREDEYTFRTSEIEKEHKARMIDLTIKGALGVGGLALTVWGTLYTTRFERDDNYTTSAGKSFVKDLFKLMK